MTPTWQGEAAPQLPPLRGGDWARIVLRGLPVLVILMGGLALLLLLRLIERPLFGMARPITPRITRGVCVLVLRVLQLPVSVSGKPMQARGAMVANHTSWLDIFVLNSQKELYFVSKAEVAGWAGIGLLARATGTLFITRDRRQAASQTLLFQDRLIHGHRLMFFPEGTSTDGLRVLPFKTTLFAACFDPRLRHRVQLQALSLNYTAPKGMDPRFYGWWGDMEFGPSMLRILAQRRQGAVALRFHPPVSVDEFADRKTLALHLEEQVRAGHQAGMLSGADG